LPYQCCGIRFSQLKNKKVIDSKNKEAGTVNDFIITYADNKIALKSLVLGGSRLEEFLESIGVRPDADPVFQIDCISQITEDVVLITDVESLKTTLDEGTIGENDMKLSKFSKLPIVDSDGLKVGRTIDVWLDINGEPWLVASGGSLDEFLEKIGVQPDLDVLIPMQFIESITPEEIKIKYTKFQLEGKCTDEYERYQRELTSGHEPGDARHAALKFNPRPQGVL